MCLLSCLKQADQRGMKAFVGRAMQLDAARALDASTAANDAARARAAALLALLGMP